MKVIFDNEALDDLRRIRALIAKDRPSAADELITRIFDKVEILQSPELTYMGRFGLDPGTHELIEYPYIIVYEVHEDRQEIVIRYIVQGAQKRKPRVL